MRTRVPSPKSKVPSPKLHVVLFLTLLLSLMVGTSIAFVQDSIRQPVGNTRGFAPPQATRHLGTGERLALRLKERGVAPELVVLAVAALPIVELRGAVPVGYNLLHLPLWKVILLSVVGNMLPIFIVVLFLDRLVLWLGRVALFKRFFDWLFRRTRSKAAGIQRDEFWGLAVFVGIPLPGTGAWTGAVAAVVLGLPYWRSLASIFLGVLMAAAAVSIPCVVFRKNPTVGAIIIGAVLSLVLVYLIVRAVLRSRALAD